MLVVVRAFDRSLLHTRRVWQVWTHSFCICRRGFDSVPGGANSLLDFLLGRGERIARHVHRFVLDFGFDYAVQSQDRVVAAHQLESSVDAAAEGPGEDDDCVGRVRPRVVLLGEDEQHQAGDHEGRDHD